ncbi:MAG: DUF4132 domain-containing protein [Myxococcales bacterium]
MRGRLTAKKPSPPLQVDEEALGAVMLAMEYGPQADDFVDYWVGAMGVGFAVDVLVTSWSFDQDQDFAARGPVRRKQPDSEAFRYGRTYGWRVLRRHLAAAEPAAYAQALEVARRHWRGAPAALKAGLAYLFPTETAWSREAAEEHLVGNLPAHAPILLGSVSDPALAERIAAALSAYHLNATLCDTPAQEYAFTLVDALGAGALGPLRKLFAISTGAAERRAFAEALAQLECREVADLFRPLVDDKHLRGIVSEYFVRHPELAQQALTSTPAAKGATARVAQAVLETATAGSAALAEEAPARALPRVLASPPWLAKVKAAAPKVVQGLEAPRYEERIEWAAGEQKEFARRFADNPKNVDWAMKEIDQRIRSSGEVNFFFLLQLQPAAIAERILRFPPSSWYNPDPRELLEFVAAAGLDSLPALLHLAGGAPQQALEVLAKFDSPRVAPAFADALVRLKKAKPFAERWLSAHPRAAALGLLPVAIGAPGKARDAAGHALRWLAARGHGELVAQAARELGAEAADAAQEVLAQDPLLLLPARLPKLPTFFRPEALPRPRLSSGAALPLPAVEASGTMLAISTADAPYAGLGEVVSACDHRSLSDFAWELTQAWLRAGAPAKESWALLALGHLGDDEAARRLTPLIRAWPGEGGNARAVLGLEVLALIGTDLALVHLNGIALRVKFKALQDKAREKIRQIAESRGLTEEELGDRLAPDLGLDADGSRVLDFGPRRFRVGFDEALRPFVLDSDGHRLDELPKPAKADDPATAAAASETWKALKKDVRSIATDQVLRLERAMCAQRRWSAGSWRALLLDHPLLTHLVRRLVWGVFDSKGDLGGSFRVAEDRSLAGPKDSVFPLPGDAVVGIAHPLELGDSAEPWSRLFADYQLLQPFPQLGRRSFAIASAEKGATALQRAEGRKVGVGQVLGLEKHGWRKAPAHDGGVSTELTKALPGGLRAVLPLDPGLFLAGPRETPEQTLGPVSVVDGSGAPCPLGALAPVTFSELVFDLDGLS